MSEKPDRSLAERMARCDKHLVIVHHPGQQAMSDWRQVSAHIRRIDPSIGVFVVSAARADEEVMRVAAQKPTLVFSASGTGKVLPLRGKVYQGYQIPKFKQLQMLAAAGVPVPQTQVLMPGIRLEPRQWGPVVLVKPLDISSSSTGLGIHLMRTERVKYIAPTDYPQDHPGRLGPMVAQQFIDSGPKFFMYRVLSLFGRALYCMQIQSDLDLVSLTADDETLERAPVALQHVPGRQRLFVYKADVMALVEATHRAIPDIPLKGIDIVREAGTGRLYVLEVNPGGNTWHFSSRHVAETRAAESPEYTRQMYEHLDAMGSAAQVLVEVTRREAV